MTRTFDASHLTRTIDGVELHAVLTGTPDRELVVLLAGFPQHSYAWHRVIPLLAERYQILAIDLPGQGLSARPAHGYDTSTVATRLHTFVGEIGRRRRHHLVAHDVGSWVAFPYGLMFGDDLLSLSLLDAGIPGVTLPESISLDPAHAWKTWHFAFHQVPDLPEELLDGKEREYVAWFLRHKSADPTTFDDADVDLYASALRSDGGLRAALGYYRAVDQSTAQNRRLLARGRLTMPVLGVSAEHGSIPDMAVALRPLGDQVRGVTIARSGHFIPEEQPAALAAELETFFGSGSASPTSAGGRQA